MRRSFLTSGALLLALAAPAAFAQVYKWTDANGVVHYGDRAPSNATQVKAPTPPAPPAASPAKPDAGAAKTNKDSEAPAATKEQQQQVQRDVAAARAEQCKNAKEEYDKAIRARRIFQNNDKGEREFVSAEEADKIRVQLKATIDETCGPQ